jgi:SprT protein
MELVKPIDDAQRQRVIDETIACIHKADYLFNQSFDLIPVSFDLMGRTAGMYRVRNGQRVIRYNPWLFARYFEDNLANTVPHEVAHYVVDMVYGCVQRSVAHLRNRKKNPSLTGLFKLRKAGTVGHAHAVRPHGKEWQALMTAFGADTRRTCSYDLDGIPVRSQKRHRYHCPCSTHLLSTCRHNKIRNKTARYFCRQCCAELIMQKAYRDII